MGGEMLDETRVGSCDVSDACDHLGVPAVRTGLLRPVWPDCPPLAGPTRSVRLEPAAGAESPLPELLEFLECSRGHVVFVDLDGRLDMQCWGTLLATAARHFGVLGALVNGAARDVEGLRVLGLPCFARCVHPAAMRGRLRIVARDQPVELEGGAVAPGSFAVVDASGGVFVPRERVAEVAARAAEGAARERRQLRSIESGTDPREALGRGRPTESA